MNWQTTENSDLVEAFGTLRTKADIRDFLRDLMTQKEITEFAKRLQCARMLKDSIPYTNIQKTTGFSSTTVARVSKWLQEGTGGYTTVLTRMHHATGSGGRGLR